MMANNLKCCRNNAPRMEIITYMIYLEGPEYHEYVMHIFYLKYSGAPQIREYVR